MAHASRQPGPPRLGERILIQLGTLAGAVPPRLVEWLAQCADRGALGPAEVGLVDGHPLPGLVGALGELRDAIVDLCTDDSTDPDELRAVHRGIDRLVTLAVTSEHARVLREASEAVRAREDILAVVSHDLRNPLGAIDLSAAMLLARVEGDPRAKKQIDTIRRSAERMDHMINDLLDISKIQAGRLPLDRKIEDACALLDEVVDLHAPLAAERGLQITRACALSGIVLDCDRDRIAQVFGNLLGNSLKFCRPGDTITVDAEPDGSFVRFSFADTGPGIAAEDVPHLFEAYYSARRHAKQGTGLGLYICRGIVEAHGGSIAVDTMPGRGARFVVILPAMGGLPASG